MSPPISVPFTIRILGESVLTVTYIINRLPTPLLKNKSPFEMLYNRPPSLSQLKSFGCLCYATVVSPKQKFDPRARQCIFIGYPLNKKVYKLFDIDACTFLTSRDVIFHESVFPFCQKSQTQSSPPLQGILPTIDIDLPTPVQHSLDQLSSSTHHNAPKPPSNQPSSPTHHNAPEPPANQPSSPTSRSLAPITKPSPIDLHVRRSSCTSTPPFWLQDYVTGSQANHLTTARMEPGILCIIFILIHDFLLHIVHILLTSQPPKNLTLMLKLSLIQIGKKQ